MHQQLLPKTSITKCKSIKPEHIVHVHCICDPLTVVIDGLRNRRLQRNQLPCRQRNRGLEAKPNWIQIKLLLPHLRLGNCSQNTAGRGWGTRSGYRPIWQSTASCHSVFKYKSKVKVCSLKPIPLFFFKYNPTPSKFKFIALTDQH